MKLINTHSGLIDDLFELYQNSSLTLHYERDKGTPCLIPFEICEGNNVVATGTVNVETDAFGEYESDLAFELFENVNNFDEVISYACLATKFRPLKRSKL